MDRKLALLFVIAIVIGIAIRSTAITSPGFYEPDVYFYYSVVSETISNNLVIPNPLPLSGFPAHNQLIERPGLIYLVAYPYAVLHSRGLGVSLYQFMRFLPLLFAVLSMLITYLLTYRLTGNRTAAVLSMLLIALLPASIARTQLGEYRGDTFAPVLLAMALLLLPGGSGKRSRYIDVARYSAMAIMALLALYSWNGSLYVLPVFALYIVGMALYSGSRNLALASSAIIAMTILAWAFVGYQFYASNYMQRSGLGNLINETQPPNLLSLFGFLGILPLLDLIALCAIIRKGVVRKGLFMALLSNLLVAAVLLSAEIRWVTLAAIPMAIFGGYGFWIAVDWLSKRFGLTWRSAAAGFITTIMVMVGVTYAAYPPYATPQLLNAAGWAANNTSPNATFLTNWEDGSVIEGFANRTSYMDSVAGLKQAQITNFSAFLLANRYNFTFLDRIRPGYLLVSSDWLYSSSYFEEEGGIQNATANESNLYLFAHPNYTEMAEPHSNVSLSAVYSSGNITIYALRYN